MTRETALKRVRKMLGAKAYWRIANGITSPEKRERYHARRMATKAAREAAHKALEARRDALLAADAEYQRLLEAYKVARAAAEDVRYHDGEGGYKFEVGTQNGIFASPRAYGDTWEEVFEKLDAQQRIEGGAR